MYVEEFRTPSFLRSPTQAHPISTPDIASIKRLALPYIYDSPTLTRPTAALIARQLKLRPDLGKCIRYIFLRQQPFPLDPLLRILSFATNVEKIGYGMPTSTSTHRMSAKAFELMARTHRLHAQRTIDHFQELADTTISTSVFAHFTDLRVLELSSDHSVKFRRNLPGSSNIPGNTKLLNVHKDHLLHLSIGYVKTEDVAFDMCKRLVVFEVRSSFDMTDLKSTTPHESLAAIFVWDLVGDPNAIDLAMFPALREIRISSKQWPTTERDISKSKQVRLAEALHQMNVKVFDSTGKCWIPRVQSSKRKR
ncbi:hypothetical protein DFH09DRAFT_1093125 [Mycena vulgaris]|nr:hypothetical protein DFH09DRAFT_1093125 [Mycena vulgaris]